MLQSKRFNKKLLVLTQLLIRKITKKRWNPLLFLLVMTFSPFVLANGLFFFTVRATYIEGTITQDTIWTLTDSPFVVSKNITVSPNVTLTIEPGVEVRFGGEFSLIVMGSLSARGAENSTITFTSNKDEPEAGDWETIKFNGTEPSTLAYCVMQYARNAITIENSNVKIEECKISTSSQNGIVIVNSTAEVRHNEIANNLESGIEITGNNQVTIQNNTIRSNADGILLTGNFTTGVSITENIVMSNTQNGIQLNADAYSNIIILDNILSANNKGFYASGQANTYITRNSISYNTIGIFYERGEDHTACYNDIYGNDYGMDVSSNTTVNAEYNYWGHESGPYHISLNPTGKGDPVGGNGTSLDFIFFLTAPIGYINERPTARLLTDKKVVSPNQIVTFIATTSSDDRRVDQYFFEFGDGKNSGWTTLSIFVHKYSSTGTYNATLRVMDDFGVTNNNISTVRITCQEILPIDVSITPNSFVAGSGEQVSITVHATSRALPVEYANITLLSIMGGSFAPSSGLTNSTGYLTATFSAPNVTRITNVRITATASKTNYADGSDYKYLMVLPLLLVQVNADPDRIKTETTSYVTVYVTDSGAPVSDAVINMSLDEGGNLSPVNGTTDENGECAFTFTPPQTTTPINITIIATATKTGYADSTNQTTIAVDLGTLNVQVTANPAIVEPKATSTVTVHVTYNAKPIANATVTVSSQPSGTLSATNGTTDENGYCTFVLTAPQATTRFDVTITAIATKIGYMDGQGQRKITVNPAAPSGLPLTTILLIVTGIACACAIVIVLVLIRLRILVISWKEV